MSLDAFLLCVHIANKRIVHIIPSARQWRLSNHLDLLLAVGTAFLPLAFVREGFLDYSTCVREPPLPLVGYY
jgi:hypothetical protein